jgi:hypothetical protein
MSTLDFYLQRAEQAGRDAEAATLANVRERHLASKAVWLEMADRLERTTTARAENEAGKALAAATP